MENGTTFHVIYAQPGNDGIIILPFFFFFWKAKIIGRSFFRVEKKERIKNTFGVRATKYWKNIFIQDCM